MASTLLTEDQLAELRSTPRARRLAGIYALPHFFRQRTIQISAPPVLAALFDLFDGDGDGLLEVEEVGTIWAACGTVLTEAEVLDMVTELKPNLRKLPYDEFVNMMCRPMVDSEALEEQLRSTFPAFAGGKTQITASSLASRLAELGKPVDSFVAEEMISEAERGDDVRGNGKVSLSEFCAMNSVRPAAKAGGGEAEAAAGGS